MAGIASFPLPTRDKCHTKQQLFTSHPYHKANV